MPAAKNKQELLEATRKELDKLKETISKADPEQAEYFDKEIEASIKSIISHRMEWIRMFFGWYQDGIDQKEPQVPAPGYKWNQLKELNAKIWERDEKKKWNQICEDFETESQKLIEFIESQDNKTLYTPKLYEWLNKWTLGRWLEASGSSHFRSANKNIKKILKKIN